MNIENDKLIDYISKINIDITNAKKINTKLKFDLGETKPRNPNQPSSDNKPSQEQK
jgi:hypothetical protein